MSKVGKMMLLAGTPGALVLSLAFATLPAQAADRAQANDQCVEQCDAKADECMSDAGDDESKQKQCDTKYEECEKKCG
jgi:hypothetical protein